MTKLHADFIRKAILLSILCDVCTIRLIQNLLHIWILRNNVSEKYKFLSLFVLDLKSNCTFYGQYVTTKLLFSNNRYSNLTSICCYRFTLCFLACMITLKIEIEMIVCQFLWDILYFFVNMSRYSSIQVWKKKLFLLGT